MEHADLEKQTKHQLMEIGLALDPPIVLPHRQSRSQMVKDLEPHFKKAEAGRTSEALADEDNAAQEPTGAEDVLDAMPPLVDPEFVAELEALAAEIKPQSQSFEYLSPTVRKWRERLHDRLMVLAEKCK